MSAPPGRPPRSISSSSKLRISSISDQDDAGPWIRREFPNLFYVVQPSSLRVAANTTTLRGPASAATPTTATAPAPISPPSPMNGSIPISAARGRWASSIRASCSSWRATRRRTSASIDNGLSSWSRPDWGGWGGRYIYRQPYGETHPDLDGGPTKYSCARPRKTPCSASTARNTSPTRPPSGAGATPSRTTSLRAWIGPFSGLRPRQPPTRSSS